jgi:hypothetical protein
MSMHSAKRPHEPRERAGVLYANGTHRAADQWSMMQNIFRMWRDFPELRFGEFLYRARLHGLNAAAFGKERGASRADPRNIRDEVLEQVCYRFWVHQSGRAIPPKVRERWA